jgi:hypothetical protein
MNLKGENKKTWRRIRQTKVMNVDRGGRTVAIGDNNAMIDGYDVRADNLDCSRLCSTTRRMKSECVEADKRRWRGVTADDDKTRG